MLKKYKIWNILYTILLDLRQKFKSWSDETVSCFEIKVFLFCFWLDNESAILIVNMVYVSKLIIGFTSMAHLCIPFIGTLHLECPMMQRFFKHTAAPLFFKLSNGVLLIFTNGDSFVSYTKRFSCLFTIHSSSQVMPFQPSFWIFESVLLIAKRLQLLFDFTFFGNNDRIIMTEVFWI